MQHQITIREATTGDADALSVLLRQLGYPQDADFVTRKLEEIAREKNARVFVADEEGQVLGFLSFDSQPAFHREGRIATITALCVLESTRGRGIGRQLVQFAELLAKQTGCVRIAVASGVERHETHRFYLSLGYEEITKRFVKEL